MINDEAISKLIRNQNEYLLTTVSINLHNVKMLPTEIVLPQEDGMDYETDMEQWLINLNDPNTDEPFINTTDKGQNDMLYLYTHVNKE